MLNDFLNPKHDAENNKLFIEAVKYEGGGIKRVWSTIPAWSTECLTATYRKSAVAAAPPSCRQPRPHAAWPVSQNTASSSSWVTSAPSRSGIRAGLQPVVWSTASSGVEKSEFIGPGEGKKKNNRSLSQFTIQKKGATFGHQLLNKKIKKRKKNGAEPRGHRHLRIISGFICCLLSHWGEFSPLT